MTGGLMQLSATGAQDVYLSGNPEITFFKVVYRKHTNFTMEVIEHAMNSAKPGARQNVEILRNGDLATNMYVRVGLPEILGDRLTYNADPVANTKVAWVKRLGHAILKHVEVEIGGASIDKQYGVWMDLLYELTHNASNDRAYKEMIGDVAELTTLTGLTANSTTEVVLPARNLYIPLQFWFCRNTGLALPLIALQYHQVRVHVEFEEIGKLLCWSGAAAPDTSNFTYDDAAIMVDYVYLDGEERRRFAQYGHEYLIEQVQFPSEETLNCCSTSSSFNQKFKLDFNHPCKEIVWAVKVGAFNGEGVRDNSRGRFLCYTEQDGVDAWNNALNYAARNLANGMLYIETVAPTNTGATWGQVTFDSDVADDTTGLASFPDSKGTIWNFTITNNGGAAITSGTNQNLWINTTAMVKNSVSLGDALVEVNVDLVAATVVSGVITAFTITGVTGSVAAATGSQLAYDAITVISHNLHIADVSVPVQDYTDSRAHLIASSTANSKWDVVVIQPANYGLRLDGRGNPVDEGNLQFNGNPRFDVQAGAYFNYVQPHQHHNRAPADGINVYSFAIHPEQHQPSGSANLSRIDSTQLVLKFSDSQRANRSIKLDYTTDSRFFIFALSWNVFRMLSGMGGLAYSN